MAVSYVTGIKHLCVDFQIKLSVRRGTLMQTGAGLGLGSVCQVNADVLSNSRTQSFCLISYNDMTYIHPRAPALMHHRETWTLWHSKRTNHANSRRQTRSGPEHVCLHLQMWQMCIHMGIWRLPKSAWIVVFFLFIFAEFILYNRN